MELSGPELIITLIVISIVFLIIGVSMAKKFSFIAEKRITLTEGERIVKESIINNDRYSVGQRSYVLPQFRKDLVKFAEETGYKGNIPGISNLHAYISPTNASKRDPGLIKLSIKMLRGWNARIV
jgi:hypothetical protein